MASSQSGPRSHPEGWKTRRSDEREDPGSSAAGRRIKSAGGETVAAGWRRG